MRPIQTLTLAIIASIAAAIISLFAQIYASSRSTQYIWVLVAVAASLVAAITSVTLLRLRGRRSNPRQIFIIYRREDLDKAHELAEWLNELGYRPWLDVDDLLPGVKWKEAIASAMLESSGALVIVPPEHEHTETAFESEIARALSVMRSRARELSPVIPVLIGGGSIPDSLKEVQAVDFRDPAGRSNLAAGLEMLAS